jgi:hypothetical protein
VEGGPPGLLRKTGEQGAYALAGYAEQVFGNAGSTAHTVSLTIRAARYQPRTVTVTVPAGAAQPVQAPDAILRPLPVRLQGRVMSTAGVQPPIAAARITSVDDPNPPSPLTEHAVLLRQTIQFAHALNTVVRPMPLTPAGGAKQLAGGAGAADTTIMLSDRVTLGAGTILQIGGAEQARFRIIQSLAPLPASTALPGEVTLTGPLGSTYPDGAAVQPMATGVAGAPAHLVRDADPGDGVLMLNKLLADETVEINDATALEYCAAGALTGSDGYYQANGVGRTRTLFLVAAHLGFVPMAAPLAWSIDYAQPIGFVDFRLSPP